MSEKKKAKAIMVQGTMSNAGKSFLVAGLCRVFKQDGYKVAPFKSQNMALNSYITKDGLEIGRAQAMQAEAADIEPTVEMNPILLKPTSNVGSQVIVNGEVLGNMKAMDYYANKRKLIPEIQKAFDKLSEEFDIIVIEGAGSPAEINLKDNDIVNMGMAKIANAPVLLAGDIDRGGVFAALYGTVKLLDEDEQQRIKGLVINKFRGDVEILRPGLRMIEERTGIPVVGVVPLKPLDIDDEDSLSERLNHKEKKGGIDLAVVRLPHISNFTDFNVFEGMEGVSLRYVRDVSELGRPDLIFLPGTKNTMDDLAWLRESGMETAVLRCSGDGIPAVIRCWAIFWRIRTMWSTAEPCGAWACYTRRPYSPRRRPGPGFRAASKMRRSFWTSPEKKCRAMRFTWAARRLWAAAGRPYTWRMVVSTACPIRRELCTAPIFTAFSTMAIWRPCW